MAELEVANKNQISAKTSKKFSSRGKTSLTGQIRTVLRLLAKIFIHMRQDIEQKYI